MTTLADTLAIRVGITAGPPTGEGPRTMVLEPYPALCVHGVVRAAVWVLMADMAGGMAADLSAGDDWVFTTDLSVRAPVLRAPRLVVATPSVLRTGRGTVATGVVLQDGDGASFGHAHAGFVRLARRPGDNPKPVPDPDVTDRWRTGSPLADPLADEAGCGVLDAANGVVEVELRDVLRNPAGAMQGAMVALVGEVAAEAIAGHHLGAPQVVTDLDVRYLAMGRVGPIVSSAGLVGPPSAGTVQVELRDRGTGDRVVAAILARTVPAPHGSGG